PDPMMFAAAVAIMLAWKTAGYWGLDYLLLPLIGTPWGHAPDNAGPAARARRAARQRLAARAVTALSVAALALLGFSLLGSAASQAAAPAPVDGPATVVLGGADFRPPVLAVHAGAGVTWRNASRVPHTVTSGAQPKA